MQKNTRIAMGLILGASALVSVGVLAQSRPAAVPTFAGNTTLTAAQLNNLVAQVNNLVAAVNNPVGKRQAFSLDAAKPMRITAVGGSGIVVCTPFSSGGVTGNCSMNDITYNNGEGFQRTTFANSVTVLLSAGDQLGISVSAGIAGVYWQPIGPNATPQVQ